MVRRGDLVLAISTGGRSPALAKKLREELGERYGPEWADVLRVLRGVRDETLPHLPDLAVRSKRWAYALNLEEAIELVRVGRHDDLHELLVGRLLDAGGTEHAEVEPS